MQVLSNERPGPLQREDNHKNIKIGLGLRFKKSSESFPEPLGKFNQTWHKSSLGGGDSSLFK
jgi:hypothetical protein